MATLVVFVRLDRHRPIGPHGLLDKRTHACPDRSRDQSVRVRSLGSQITTCLIGFQCFFGKLTRPSISGKNCRLFAIGIPIPEGASLMSIPESLHGILGTGSGRVSISAEVACSRQGILADF